MCAELDGAARRDGGVTRPQQAEAVPGKDAGAEMKAVGDYCVRTNRTSAER